MAVTDTSYLERHGAQWRVTVKVPKAARERVGKTFLKHPLGTGDLATANRLKWQHIDRLKRIIEDIAAPVSKDVLGEARAVRAEYALGHHHTTDDLAAAVEVRAEQLEAIHGEEVASTFAKLALRQATPLREHLEAFISDWDYQPKSILELRRAIDRLEEYMTANRKTVALEKVDGLVAIGFMRDLVHERALSRKNAGKYVSFLRTFWTWMEDNNHLPPKSSPWDVKLPKSKKVARHNDLAQDGGKRPYSDPEVATLLGGRPPKQSAYLSDLMPLAALSGMRLEELYRLRVRDCLDGFYSLGDGKTKNAQRRVPIHPSAAGIVERLSAGLAPEAYLIDPTAEVVAQTGIRSSAASKAFTRYRRAVGVDERPNDKAKSNVDFHSFRRWFIKKAKEALDAGAVGFTAWTIADVVGHDDDGMKDILRLTMSHYPGPSGDAARIACVAAVQLPKGEANGQ